MVLAGEVLADAVLHQAGKRRQHGDRRVHALVGQFAAEHDLAFGDVAGEVGNRVGDVVRRHRQHRDHGDGAAPVLDAPCPLVKLGEVGIQIAGIALARRHVAAQHRHFAQRLGVGGHVGHHHQHVVVEVEGQVFGRGEGGARGQQAFDHRLVGEVEEHHHLVRAPRFPRSFPGRSARRRARRRRRRTRSRIRRLPRPAAWPGARSAPPPGCAAGRRRKRSAASARASANSCRRWRKCRSG